jgi:hypothetical protein
VTLAELAVPCDLAVFDIDPGPQLIRQPDRVGGDQVVKIVEPGRVVAGPSG